MAFSDQNVPEMSKPNHKNRVIKVKSIKIQHPELLQESPDRNKLQRRKTQMNELKNNIFYLILNFPNTPTLRCF